MIYVVFMPTKDFPIKSHVCVLHKLKNQWYLINPFTYSYNMTIDPLSDAHVKRILSRYKCYEYNDNMSVKYKHGASMYLSCVSMVKFYLGIKDLLIFTPKHLEEFLLGEKISALQRIFRGFEFIRMYILWKIVR